MFHISTHTQLFLTGGLVEPILALNVVSFLLSCGKGGELKCEIGLRIEVAGERGGTEERAELVLLLSVEIDFEGLGIVHRAEFRFSVFRLKVVVIVGVVAQYVEAPSPVGPPGEVGLIVKEVGAVFSVGVGRP